MQTMKLVLIASALALVPTHAMAGPDTNIHVTAKPVTLAKWTHRTSRMLTRNLRYPQHLRGPQEGIVSVKFLSSDTGAPSNVALFTSSGSDRLDAAALKAVTNIPTLHPLPKGMARSQKFIATILFAQDQASYDRQIRDLRQSADRKNKSFKDRHPALALGIGLLNEETPDVQVN